MKSFRDGDWRSGYYRDQTFLLAAGMITPVEFFAQLYGDTSRENNPSTGGRNFNNHHSTANRMPGGSFHQLARMKNSAADLSPTAGQIPRLLGLAQATKLVREHPEFAEHTKDLITGNEVAFGSIGESSTSEGMFFETINAACVLQVPLAMAICREKHQPVIFHVDELTQPLGHSTSGSHERYKTPERLQWEKDFDAIKKFKEWILEQDLADEETLDRIEEAASQEAKSARDEAWHNFKSGFEAERIALKVITESISKQHSPLSNKKWELNELFKASFPNRKDLIRFAHALSRSIAGIRETTIIGQGIGLALRGFKPIAEIQYLDYLITKSLQKTNKLVLLDEDVPGGGTGYMLQKILEDEVAFYSLDARPLVISAKDHRGAYGTDSEYFSKPNEDSVVEEVWKVLKVS